MPSSVLCVAGAATLLAAALCGRAATYHVSAGTGSDALDGLSWGAAKQTIQAAVDAAGPNDIVLVTNGVYAAGGRAVHGAMTNRVAIAKPITVQSVHGAAATIIQGQWHPAASNGDLAVRCVYIGTNATLIGFTLTGGATRTTGDLAREACGGGAWCEPSGVLSNCTVAGNAAGANGGGVYDGTLCRCALSGNSAVDGGGAYKSTLHHCVLTGNVADQGGGSYFGTLHHCTLAGNSAREGGGSYLNTLNDCVLTGNAASENGGGSNQGTLNNCTLTGNSALSAGGAYYGTLNNCIVYGNTALVDANYSSGSTLRYSCTAPAPQNGVGNITDEPQFAAAAAGNYRLRGSSPCVNRGINAFVQGGEDRDGQPRIVKGVVDMGAYEFQGYWAWAAAITNGLTNETDCAAGDGYPNLLKYATGGSPMSSDGLARVQGGLSDGVLTLVFNRSTNAPDVTVMAQACSSVSNDAVWLGVATNRDGSWGGATNVTEAGASNPVVVTVRDVVRAQTNRFMRLQLVAP